MSAAGFAPLTRAATLLAALAAPVGLACCAMATDPGGSGASAPASDALGTGGQLDQIYREIYHPGSGTQW